jgi:hypothetical protein
MKSYQDHVSILSFLFLNFFLLMSTSLSAQNPNLVGAWESGPPENHIAMIMSEHYWSAVVINKTNNTYVGTCGGIWHLEKDQLTELHEFNTIMPERVGIETKSIITLKGEKLTLKTADESELFTRIDSGKPGQLAGAWLITGRTTPQGVQKITPGVRKTMKILSGTRFQWIAYNTETKEFFGTGGGTYTTENGKYTENIDVFSRDNSRVGAKLVFDFTIENGDWHHKGLSSKGDPIDEFWTRREVLEK